MKRGVILKNVIIELVASWENEKANFGLYIYAKWRYRELSFSGFITFDFLISVHARPDRATECAINASSDRGVAISRKFYHATNYTYRKIPTIAWKYSAGKKNFLLLQKYLNCLFFIAKHIFDNTAVFRSNFEEKKWCFFSILK